jgi:regulatory protein
VTAPDPPERTPEEALAYAKERALRLLAVRPRSHAELAERLSRIGTDPDILRQALADLERVGLIDDAAFARDLVESRTQNRLEGDRAVRAALWAKGIAPELVDGALAEVGTSDQERADELARKRALRLQGLPPERAYARLLGLLQRRGHGYAVASSAARRALRVEGIGED